MRSIHILAPLLFLCTVVNSQINLVPNPGFEIASPCPNYPGQINYATGWNNVNLVYNNFTVGTPDFFHACGTTSVGYNAQPPATFAGTCNPHTGNGFAASVMYNTPFPNAREYIATKLTCPMITGQTYTVSFWITNGTGPKSPFIIRNVGANFSTAPLTQAGLNVINLTPQCEITGYSGTNAWVQYTFAITATANWEYITLGNFRPDASNFPMSVYPGTSGPSSVYANYFWDDISVIGNGSTIPATISGQNISCNSTNNGSATITPTSPGTYTYNWQPGNQSTQSINNLSAGIYSVNVTDGCNSTTQTISITQMPSPTVSINSVTTCANSFVNITANVSGGSPNYTYTWSQGVSTTSIATINASSSVITCTVTDSQGCKATGSAPITITPVNADFLFSLNPCNGVITTTNTTTGANLYNWNFGDGFTSNAVSPSNTYSTSGTYSIVLIANTAAGCSDTIYKVVTISSISQSIFTSTNSICDSTVYLNNNSIGANTYLWNFGDGSTSSLSNPGQHVYSNSGTYTISLITNPGTSCADTAYQTISISKNVISQFNISSSPCTMSVSTINTSSFATTYLWDFGDGFTSTSNNSSHNYSSTGNYTIALIANPGTTCADTTYQPVTISGAPVALFSYIQDPCSGTVTFTNNSINSTSYQWNFGGANTSNLTNPTFNFNKPGTYTVSLTAQPSFPCASTVTQTIVVSFMQVTANFSYHNPQYTNDVYFTNLSQNAIKYEWSFGDGFSATGFEPSHTYSQMGEFTTCLLATNSIGCSDIICKRIKVDSDWTLYIPDAFTPNTDGLNDLFFAKGTNISKFTIVIYDRWGEKIFSSDDIMIGWDGKYKGKLVQEDVYIWKINFTDIYSKSHEKTGHVTVIR
ncbi:MAG: PKD domain-containing protein [Bacteroidia bacterium]|nr:PKD domain-containing protein [Bacteroidia bacterium]